MPMRDKNSCRFSTRRIIAAAITAAVIIPLYAWGFALKTENYYVDSEKISEKLTVAFISDLHNCFYGGTDQSGIIGEVEKADPDIVIFGGDIVDQYGGTKNALTLADALADDYSCFYAEGNHEHLRDDTDEFKSDLEAVGVTILNGGKSELSINGQSVTVYGIIDTFQWGKSEPLINEYVKNLDNDSYNILIAHLPEHIDEYLGRDFNTEQSFDLILSGHAHGGQWRIPGILEQGLYAPDQGIFPDYTNGMYEYSNSIHIISRGLARPLRMILIPRIFNRPELSIIEIQ